MFKYSVFLFSICSVLINLPTGKYNINENMDKTETKSKVFRAAADLFSEKGYYNVSVREICDAAGVTKPVLYYYFKDKEDLLESLLSETDEIKNKLFEEHLSMENTFEENLDGLYKVYVLFAEEYPYLIRLSTLIQFSPLPQKIKIISKKRSEEQYKRIISLFQHAKKEEAIDKSTSLDMLVLSLIAPLGILVAQNIIFGDSQAPLHKSLKKYFDFWKEHFIKNRAAE
jgi:AcrR family transcriptional regulator